MSIALDVATWLATQTAWVVGTDLFIGYLPGTPDTAVMLFERPGRPPIRASAKTVIVERPGLQILTRSLDYETAYDRAVVAKNLLQTFSGTIGGKRYLDISAAGGIHPLGTDELKRYTFSLNFGLQKEAA